MLTLENLNKEFIDHNQHKDLFSKFDLKIQKGERVGVFAPNACGKTTLFNIIMGIDNEYSGCVKLNTNRASYMNQNPQATLLPWYSCKKNILLMRKYHLMSVDDGIVLLDRLIEALNVNFSLDLYPFQLSGGQSQIVALLRALIIEPEFLLMDEPFSALDTEKRSVVKRVLHSLFDDGGITILLCSHRGDEVNTLLNRIIILGSRSATTILKDHQQQDFNTRREFENYIAKINFNQLSNESKTAINRDFVDTGCLADNLLV